MEGGRNRLSRKESREQTRARLLDAAATVFAERGFYGASVEVIAERAGFSKGAFYSNFETKDDLLLALLDDHIQADMAALERIGHDNTAQSFLGFISSRAARRAAEGERWTLLSAELWLHALRNPGLLPKLAARQQAGRAALAAVIEGVCARMGLCLPGPAVDLASVMLAIDDGLVLQEALDRAAVPDDLRVQTLAWIVQGMIGGEASGRAAVNSSIFSVPGGAPTRRSTRGGPDEVSS